MSQFGRAMKDLGVELICAHSPQAKGRVERQNGVLQDRLVKALRLGAISALEKANQFLEKRFLKEFNSRFEVRAANLTDVHRRVPRETDLALALSIQEERVVCNDWTIQWRGRWLQLTASNRKLALAKQRVTVCEQLDGRIRVRFRGRDLEYAELPDKPDRRDESAKDRSGPSKSSKGKGPWKPASDHPWRTGL